MTWWSWFCVNPGRIPGCPFVVVSAGGRGGCDEQQQQQQQPRRDANWVMAIICLWTYTRKGALACSGLVCALTTRSPCLSVQRIRGITQLSWCKIQMPEHIVPEWLVVINYQCNPINLHELNSCAVAATTLCIHLPIQAVVLVLVRD